MKTNRIKQVRVLYALFAGILLICLGLFFFNVIGSADDSQVVQIPQAEDYQHSFFITDLIADESVYAVSHVIEGTRDSLTARAHVSEYTVEFATNKGDYMGAPLATWILILQWFGPLALLAIIVLVAIVLVSFYRSSKQGKVFPIKQVSLLVVIGLLVIAVSLSSDTRAFLERQMAADLLAGTDWEPAVGFTIHFVNIFFGLTIIFLAHIFKIGREMQEDQELTI
jgi:hypothetical protein